MQGSSAELQEASAQLAELTSKLQTQQVAAHWSTRVRVRVGATNVLDALLQVTVSVLQELQAAKDELGVSRRREEALQQQVELRSKVTPGDRLGLAG